MKELAINTERNSAIHRKMRILAQQTRTDVEGLVAWLAISYNPWDAWEELLR